MDNPPQLLGPPKEDQPATYLQTPVGVVKTFDKEIERRTLNNNPRMLTLLQIELCELAAAIGYVSLLADPKGRAAKIGGIYAGLLRAVQRLESPEHPASPET